MSQCSVVLTIAKTKYPFSMALELRVLLCSYTIITWILYLMHGPVPKFSLQDTG